MESLNLGILAHVDAGKTTLTERLLYEAGAIDRPGSVDEGDTQTDTLAVERRRGITVRSAVVSFEIENVSVKLIDTPGHPDFIAEVERILRILDGAVLVLSSVEGIQPQTRVLMRALLRLRIPTLLFANKIDRQGAREGSLLQEIRHTLGLTIVPMGTTSAISTKDADFKPWAVEDSGHRAVLAESLGTHDERLLSDYLADEDRLDCDRLERELRSQSRQGLVNPVFFGSARTGAGVHSLMSGIADLLPRSALVDPAAQTSGTVFKIERGKSREKIAYVRLYSGTVRTRDHLVYGQGHEDKVVAVEIPKGRPELRERSVADRNIVKIWGLKDVKIGDRIGQAGSDESVHQFAPPTMESVVRPCDPADGARLRGALGELSEQDPLIGVRLDGDANEISVSLYGEVQKEIVQSALEDDYGIEVEFRETTTIYVERPVRRGEATELLTSDANPHMATVGLRVDPGPEDSGVTFALDVDKRSLPLFIYKSEVRFVDHMTQYVRRALGRGPHGWEVTDCMVTLTECDYFIGDGPTKPTVPMARTTSADFRLLTPLVVSQAVVRAGTRVCEPMLQLRVESPSRNIGELLDAIVRLGGSVAETQARAGPSTIEARMPADRVREFQRRLPGLSEGEGSLESVFDGYQPVQGRPPRRTSQSGGRSS